MKTDNFIDLMKDFQINHNKNNEKTIFLDNAFVHHSKKFKEFVKETKIHALYKKCYNISYK
jgi:transposase